MEETKKEEDAIHPIKLLKETGGTKRFLLRCWIADNQIKPTKTEKTYTQLVLADKEIRESLKIWDNYGCAALAKTLENGNVVDVEGNFSHGQYGLEADNSLSITLVPKEEAKEWFQNALNNEKAVIALKQAQFYVLSVENPLLKEIGEITLSQYGNDYLQSGGARFFHHSRRGGLIEHSAKMMESAWTLAPIYKLNRDLVVIGALVHDIGKIFENRYEDEELTMPFNPEGELLSHIPKGILIVEEIIKEAKSNLIERGVELSNEQYNKTRIHLLHLISSHHGTYEFGSPVTPKTKEALLLHTVDNLDAKIEFFNEALENAKVVATVNGVTLHEKSFPFPGCIAQSL